MDFAPRLNRNEEELSKMGVIFIDAKENLLENVVAFDNLALRAATFYACCFIAKLRSMTAVASTRVHYRTVPSGRTDWNLHPDRSAKWQLSTQRSALMQIGGEIQPHENSP